MNRRELLMRTRRVSFSVPLNVTLTQNNEILIVDNLLKFYKKKKGMVMDGIRLLHHLRRTHLKYSDGRTWKEFSDWSIKAIENTMRKRSEK